MPFSTVLPSCRGDLCSHCSTFSRTVLLLGRAFVEWTVRPTEESFLGFDHDLAIVVRAAKLESIEEKKKGRRREKEQTGRGAEREWSVRNKDKRMEKGCSSKLSSQGT
jgi:hypothetical protein